jgi:hypothetical protein
MRGGPRTRPWLLGTHLLNSEGDNTVYGNTVQNVGAGALAATGSFIAGGYVVGTVVLLVVGLLLLRLGWRQRLAA